MIAMQINSAGFQKRCGKKHAIIAIYHILKADEVFNPSDMADVETAKKQCIEYIKNNLRNAFNQLIRTGLTDEEILQIVTMKSNSPPHAE